MNFALIALLFVSSSAHANIVEIDQNIVSEKCAKRVVKAIERNPTVNVYLGDEDESVSMEFNEDDEKTIYCVVSVIGDSHGGYTVAEFNLTKLPNGDCKVGRLVNWDSAY